MKEKRTEARNEKKMKEKRKNSKKQENKKKHTQGGERETEEWSKKIQKQSVKV